MTIVTIQMSFCLNGTKIREEISFWGGMTLLFYPIVTSRIFSLHFFPVTLFVNYFHLQTDFSQGLSPKSKFIANFLEQYDI